jgi:prepilin-type N-terminal cleavage/methylation domain-containing protein
MNKNSQDKGFTLVELLIVIVILGILATVTVFAVRGITDDSRQNSCAAEQRTIETAIEAYYADNGTDPTATTDLVPTFLKQNPFTTAAGTDLGSGHFAIFFIGEDTDPGAATTLATEVTLAAGSCDLIA